MFFGRRDSLTASRAEANLRLPSPRLNYEELKGNFAFWGMNEVDLIALSGSNSFYFRVLLSLRYTTSITTDHRPSYITFLIISMFQVNPVARYDSQVLTHLAESGAEW